MTDRALGTAPRATSSTTSSAPSTGMRTTFRWKADGLDRAGLAQHIGVSALTLGGLLKHLAAVEDTTFSLEARRPAPRRDLAPGDLGRERHRAPVRGRRHPRAALRRVGRRRRPVARPARRPRWRAAGWTSRCRDGDDDGNHANLRRLLFDLLEEYGRHTGHADLLREAVDGRVGEDPPLDWRPVSGAPLTWIRDW